MITSRYIKLVTALLVCISLLICAYMVFAAQTRQIEQISQTAKITEYQKRLFQGELIIIDIQVQEDDWQTLLDNARDKDWINADLIINGEFFSFVGIRVKGNSNIAKVISSDSDRFSLQVKFNKYVKGQTYYGLDTFCLNNLIYDATYMKEYMAFEIMDYIGVPTPLRNYANVSVNGESYGLYLALERYNEAFLDRVYGSSSGQLYNVKNTKGKNDFYGGSLLYNGDDVSNYPEIFNNKVFGNKSDKHDKLVIEAILNLNEGANLSQHFDIDEVLRYLAALSVISSTNSYATYQGQNYYIHVRDGKLSILPWSFGQAFGGILPTDEFYVSKIINIPIDSPVLGVEMVDRPLINNLLAIPEYRDSYHMYLRQIIDGFFASGIFDETIAMLDKKISQHIIGDDIGFASYEAYTYAVAALHEFGILRSLSIEGQLSGIIPSTLDSQNIDRSLLVDVSHFDYSPLAGSSSSSSLWSFDNISQIINQHIGDMKSQIFLENDEIRSDNADIIISNQTATIKSGGIYEISGTLENGQIIVNATAADVVLILNNVDITCTYSSPIYIYDCNTITIYTPENTINILTDGAKYNFDNRLFSQSNDEPNACLYSKSDMFITGGGTLHISANYNNGITSKDNLKIENATIHLLAKNNGINGRDSCEIIDSDILVQCGGDAIRSTYDMDDTRGIVSISNSTLNLNAGKDGISAQTHLSIFSGDIKIISGGGSTNRTSSSYSTKGMKAGKIIEISGGVISIDSSDDGIHCDDTIDISEGHITISAKDDGIHADKIINISGGFIDIVTSYEGIEGREINISGGYIKIFAIDDAISCASPQVSHSGFFDITRYQPTNNEKLSVHISGGYVEIYSTGDGIDSNGSLIISGGTVISIINAAGIPGSFAIDTDGGFTLTGGTVIAGGTAAIYQFPVNSPLSSISVPNVTEGMHILIKSPSEIIFDYTADHDATSTIFFHEKLIDGDIYTVVLNGIESETTAGTRRLPR
ncbi:MAG: carbohydrate-binding domain-containing protein [Oscillospiraceae bacterium]|nr:carbohydrate-binding domain-containing protein [Oscillospiraceae bacterium]